MTAESSLTLRASSATARRFERFPCSLPAEIEQQLQCQVLRDRDRMIKSALADGSINRFGIALMSQCDSEEPPWNGLGV